MKFTRMDTGANAGELHLTCQGNCPNGCPLYFRRALNTARWYIKHCCTFSGVALATTVAGSPVPSSGVDYWGADAFPTSPSASLDIRSNAESGSPSLGLCGEKNPYHSGVCATQTLERSIEGTIRGNSLRKCKFIFLASYLHFPFSSNYDLQSLQKAPLHIHHFPAATS